MARTMVVTGATGGIGRAVVERLLNDGNRVLGVVRSADHLPERAEPVVLDLAEPLEAPPALATLDQLDALVHCAGIADVESIAETTPSLLERTLRVNLTAAAELTRMLLPGLRAASGQVVFLNMANRARPVPRWAAYVASKAALAQYADTLRLEERAVRVTTIYPGGTATELLAQVRGDFGAAYDPADAIQPETIAWYVTQALDSPADAYPSELTITYRRAAG